MAVKSLDESNRLFAVEVDMENRSPDEIAKDSALQIIAIFDRLNEEQKEKQNGQFLHRLIRYFDQNWTHFFSSGVNESMLSL